MIAAGVAILVAIGLGIWAFTVHSDLNDTQADLDAQKAATLQAQAQVKAQTDAANAAAAELEKISTDNEIFVVSNEDVAQAQSDVATAEQAVTEASANVSAAQDQLAKVSAERDQARAERDLARAERQEARICSRGSLGVISKLGKGEADAASSELETVSSACAASVSG
jgi:multidrug resistance efflux pump